jgi:Delta7-sterol 5-desaturase
MEWIKILGIALENVRNYLLIAGIAFVLSYIIYKKALSSRKIQERFPLRADYRREVWYSMLSMIIFTLFPTILLLNPNIKPHTTFYEDINQYSTAYFIFAFFLMTIMHDTYFYWTHRLIHHPFLFKIVHLVHHKSTNPSPWAAYAFHPFEAIVNAGIFAVILFTIPVHGWHLFLFFVLSLTYNVYGHLGYELYPQGFNKHWFGKWINTSVTHNMHHKHFDGNYGLYFLFWDRWMGTLRKDYDDSFEKVTSVKS